MNDKIVRIKISEFVPGNIAVSSDDGDIVHSEIIKFISQHIHVVLDFESITLITTAFLNSAIGQLYSVYTSEELNQSLRIANIADEDKILFKKVIERAKEYFANKKGFEGSANSTMYEN